MRVLFMGTPDFAIPALRALASAHEVVCVVSQPDKPKGRGMQLHPTPVKSAAQELGIEVRQPVTLKDGAFLPDLEGLRPDVIVVVAYGKILPEYVLNFPKFGCINIHGSLLPAYRGAAPMQRAIMDGNRVTGITTMQMAKGLDTGDMLEIAEVEIAENDNFEVIHDKLAQAGADLILSTLAGLEAGTITPVKQDDSLATYAAKIEKSDCVLDFTRSAEELHDQIRGLSPIPLAFTKLNGKLLKIVTSKVSPESSTKAPGTVLSIDKGVIAVATGDGILHITDVLPEGKGRMSAAAFVNGKKIAVGDVLGN
ncbi:MAG: methionyl-tRNA formyltransferase [Clostridia bacterium]|nr:methionyl-tRNA formyltransferase [Clostridia bacterium]